MYLYATNATEQYNYIKAANDKGYNVLLLDGQLDNHFVYHQRITVRQLTIETHTRLHGGHFLHTAHILVLRKEKAVGEARKAQNEAIAAYAKGEPVVSQLIDLALLGNGLLTYRAAF